MSHCALKPEERAVWTVYVALNPKHDKWLVPVHVHIATFEGSITFLVPGSSSC